MALKPKKKQERASGSTKLRKTKFQADLAPAEDRIVRMLKQELQVASNTDFLADAVTLFRWAVSERRLGRRIISESASGDRKVLVFPRLERVAPDLVLPRVESDGPRGNWRALPNSHPQSKRSLRPKL
jgi:hypothetical protein